MVKLAATGFGAGALAGAAAQVFTGECAFVELLVLVLLGLVLGIPLPRPSWWPTSGDDDEGAG